MFVSFEGVELHLVFIEVAIASPLATKLVGEHHIMVLFVIYAQ
jgi:hypothetical protein